MHLFHSLKAQIEALVVEVLKYDSNEFEIVKIKTESSRLFEEIIVLISYKKKDGIFHRPRELQELKYDTSNKCGVLTRVIDEKYSKTDVIKTFGEVSVLREKRWI